MVKLDGESITLDIWIMLWNYLAYVDAVKCYKSMTFIGLDITFENAFKFNDGQVSSLCSKKNRHIL